MKIFLVLLVSVLLINTVAALDELCESDSDCNDKNEERCQKSEACSSGSCVCKTGLKPDNNNICIQTKQLGTICSVDAECGENAECDGSKKCSCLTTANATGNTHCVRATVGQPCSLNKPCGYGSDCNATCYCPGDSEKRSNVYYRTYSKEAIDGCVHKNSKSGIAEGGRCTNAAIDPEKPQLLCSAGLTCRLCPEHSGSSIQQHVCVKEAFGSGRIIGANAVLLFSIAIVTKLL